MKRIASVVALYVPLILGGTSAASTVDVNGEAVFAKHCASCHEGSHIKAPAKLFLSMMAPDMIYRALDSGIMEVQASVLDDAQKRAVAEYLTDSKLGEAVRQTPANMCGPQRRQFDLSEPPAYTGWGVNERNHRFMEAEDTGLGAADVPRLKLKWAFGFPGATRARSQAMFAMGAVFVGSQDGTVYALDRETGCVRWTYRASAEVRTPVVIEGWAPGEEPASPPLAYFADHMARVYAVEATTGKLRWKMKVDDHPNATVTGSPVLHEGRLYVPVSSLEVATAGDPDYSCCTFQGAVAALDAATGEQVWKTRTIPTPPERVGETSVGTPVLAPSGAPVWNSPTIDPARGLLYVGTGENYSSPANDTSDALLAFRLADGKLMWSRQATAGDAWNNACMMENKANCPEENGPDLDFGAGTMLVTLPNGKPLLLAGQKSGDVYAIDATTRGDIFWQKKVGRGGIQGGVHFGMAYGAGKLFVPITDMSDKEAENYAWNIPGKPGLYALDVSDGSMLWEAPADNICAETARYCEPGISQAITAMPGVVFAGHMDGRLRAYSSESGEVLWEFYTDQRKFDTVNGVPASGGSFGGGAGPTVHKGMLFASSGYGIYYHRPGNVLLAFSVDGE